MTDPSSAAESAADTAARPGVRWWPALLIVACVIAGLGLGWTRTVGQRQERIQWTLASLLLGGMALFGWVLLLSRLRWRVRLSIVGLLLLAGVGLRYSVRWAGVTGDLQPILEWRWSRRAAPPVAAEPALPGPSAASTVARAYPQFQGPTRDGVVRGVTLEPDWAAHPPVEIWRRPVGDGWSGFAVAAGRAVTHEQHDASERVVCYDLGSGAPLWAHDEPARYASPVGGTGPRATPTIASGRVYALGSTGILVCLELTTGKRLWRHDIVAEAKGEVFRWGMASSPLVIGDRVIVNAGGQPGWALLAYHRETGALLWHGGDHRGGYSSATLVTLAGRRQLLIFDRAQLAAHDPDTGAVLWTYPWKVVECVSVPVVVGPAELLVSSGYGVGAVRLRLAERAGTLGPELVWRSRRLRAKFTNLILRDGVVYGLSDGVLSAFDVSNGKRLWRGPRFGHGQVIAVGELLLVQSEPGPVVLLRVTREGHQELGRIEALSSKTWNPPALAAPFLLVRNDREAVCYRLTQRP